MNNFFNMAIEKYVPLLLPPVCAFLLFLYAPELDDLNRKKALNINAVFAPIFDFTLFSAGLLFTVYVVILGPSRGFIKKIFHTKIFERFHLYICCSISANMLVATFTVYYMVAQFPTHPSIFEKGVIALWFYLTTHAITTVIRVVYIFIMAVGIEIRSSRKP